MLWPVSLKGEKQVAQEDMRQMILDFPKQFVWSPQIKNIGSSQRGLEIYEGQTKYVVGLGGSALAGEIMSLLHYQPGPVIVHRQKTLPNNADGDVIVAISHSGNTEEAIEALAAAHQAHLQTIAIASGGRLMHLAMGLGEPFIAIPNQSMGWELPPRLAVGFNSIALAATFAEDTDRLHLRALAESLKPGECESLGKDFALKFKDKKIKIYSSYRLRPLAYFWKVQLMETAKVEVSTNYFPELVHNELITLTPDHVVIMLHDPSGLNQDNLLESKFARWLTDKQILWARFDIHLVPNSAQNEQNLFTNCILAYWTSYYLALELGRDPLDISAIEDFKKMP